MRLAFRISTKKEVKNYDETKNSSNPFTFKDWKGENKILKSKELKKSLYSQGHEAEIVSSRDLIFSTSRCVKRV
jgi:hypothetical protein